MTVPLVVLATGTVAIGLLVGMPPESGLLAQWLDPVFEPPIAPGPHREVYQLFGVDGALVLLSVGVASVGIGFAWRLFGVEILALRRAPDPRAVLSVAERTALTRFLYRASLNKWWFDDLYHVLFIRIGGAVARGARAFDHLVVDGIVNGIGQVTVGAGDRLRTIQTGRVQNYGLGIAAGLVIMAAAYLLMGSR